MGCGPSSAVVSEADKATLANAQFTAIPPVWSGIAAMEGDTLIANGATIEDAAGKVILNVANDKAVFWALSDPATGQVVMTVSKPDGGNWGKTSITMNINSATGLVGSFEVPMTFAGPRELIYLDTSGALVMKAKFYSSYILKIFGPDGKSLAAVVTGSSGLGTVHTCKQCTFAKGADPIIALAMAPALMEVIAQAGPGL